MLHIRQPFYSITTSGIFTILGLLFGLEAAKGTTVPLGVVDLNSAMTWGLTGLLFLMAYFALVHLRYK